MIDSASRVRHAVVVIIASDFNYAGIDWRHFRRYRVRDHHLSRAEADQPLGTLAPAEESSERVSNRQWRRADSCRA